MDSFKEYVDVTQPPFNAVGDGKTDDSAAFQKAVDSLNGGEVRFPRDEGLSARATPSAQERASDCEDV